MKIVQLEDGRFPNVGNVAWLGGHFIVYGKPKDKVIVLDPERRFKRQTTFKEILGENDSDLVNISPYRGDQSLLTFYKNKRKRHINPIFRR